MKGYQENFSLQHPQVYFESENRARKAEKILRILKDAYKGGFSGLHVLDVGCSTGAMCRLLASHFEEVTGIDIDRHAIDYATTTNELSNVRYQIGDAMKTGLEPESIDVVLCAHVYEHVPDPFRMMAEIQRILRPGGVCYFAAENRLVFREGDYRLPLLSILPKPLAHWYVRLARRGDHYYETLFTYWQLRRLTAGFERIDYTRRVVAEPDAFGAADMVPHGSMRQRLALMMLDHAYWLFPNYLWVLRKFNERA